MSDSFKVVSNESFLGNIGGAIIGVGIGLILFIASFPLLYWNESRAVKTALSLKEGLGAVIHVPAENVAPENEGKLVHVSSAVKTDAPVADADLGISSDGVKLIRNVEMYQWKENKESHSRKKLGGGTETVTEYKYERVWAPDRIDSSKFKQTEGHENPEAPALQSKTFTAEAVHAGAFNLSNEQLDKLDTRTDLPVAEGALDNVGEDWKDKLKVSNGKFYMGEDPAAPKLGDVRIAYQLVKPEAVSLVGVQKASTFTPFQASAGDAILLVKEGMHTAQEMFKEAQDQNVVLTWILRGVGFVVMLIGLCLVGRPLAVLGNIIPFVGSMLGAGIFFFSLLASAVLSLTTIAISWVVVRPVLGISMLALAAGVMFLLYRMGHSRKHASLPGEPVPASANPGQ